MPSRNVLAAILFFCVIVAAARCATSPTVPPAPTLSALDQAVLECLDYAWEFNHVREVAGGVVSQPSGALVCTELTLGTRNLVRYVMTPDWLAHYHTHTAPGPLSPTDRVAVVQDVFRRPSYVRQPSGTVDVFECGDMYNPDVCRLRRVR